MFTFLDNFSGQAPQYAKHRPRYPQALYDFLLSEVRHRESAWDCATGNGQVATVLARYFHQVCATDASVAQLAQAEPATTLNGAPIEYRACMAEQTPFPDDSFNLITVAQALHWLNFDKFYAEVRRVMKPGGLLATWGYGLMRTPLPAVNALIGAFSTGTVGPYWDRERTYVDEAYRTLPFPFPELPHPEFQTEVTWTLEDCLGYLRTWSSVQKFIRAESYDPVEVLGARLTAEWTVTETVTFPIFVRAAVVGR